MDERRSPRHEGPSPIGEMLLAAGLVNRAQLREALRLQAQQGGRLGHILVDQGFVDPVSFAETLADQLGLAFFDLELTEIDPRVASLVPMEVARHHRLLPVAARAGRITLVMADPSNELGRREVERLTGSAVRLALAPSDQIQAALTRTEARLAEVAALEDAFEKILGEPEAATTVPLSRAV